jgi:hypothetical protein
MARRAVDADLAAEARTMSRITASPSPVPPVSTLVLKNGSKMRSWVCASMPWPVSDSEM